MRSVIVKIREQDCIGCTKCIQACPVDAIIGSSKFMHTVIESECIGCELCIKPCPVDCIDLIEYDTYAGLTENTLAQYKSARANHTKERYRTRSQRLEKEEKEKQERYSKMREILLKANKINE